MTVSPRFETQLRDALAEHGERLQADIDTTAQLRVLTARFPRERRRLRLQVAGVAMTAVAAAAAIVFALAQLSPVTGSNAPLPAGPPSLPAPAPTLAATAIGQPPAAESAARFTQPSVGLIAGGALWVDDVHETTVTRLDPRTLRQLGRHSYASWEPVATGPLVAADGVVLLPVDDSNAGGVAQILRFNEHTGRELAPIAVMRAGAIAVTPIGVFAQVGPDLVGVVDPRAGRVERSFRLPVDRGLAYSDGLLWGWDFGHSALVGVDAATGHRQRSIALPGFSDLPMAADGSAAMLVEGPDGLARVDLRTGRVTATSAVAPLNVSRDNAGRWWGVVVGGTRVACLDGRTLRMLGDFRVRSVDGLQVLGDRLYASDRSSDKIVAYVLSQLRVAR